MPLDQLTLALMGAGGAQNGSGMPTDPALLTALPRLQLEQSMMQAGANTSTAPATRWGGLARALAGGGTSKAKAALALAREGRRLLQQGNLSLAERRFEKALSVDASCGQAYLGMAELRYEQGDWQQATALASKAAYH